MDHNSYNKDDETNWINFDDLTLNAPLSHYYRCLIQIRHQSPALRKSAPEAIRFDHVSDPLFLCIHIDGGSAEDLHDYYIALNGNSGRELELTLPEGYWELLADNELASSSSIDFISNRKSTRLNSSHVAISYAVFCLKKKNQLLPPTISKPHI